MRLTIHKGRYSMVCRANELAGANTIDASGNGGMRRHFLSMGLQLLQRKYA